MSSSNGDNGSFKGGGSYTALENARAVDPETRRKTLCMRRPSMAHLAAIGGEHPPSQTPATPEERPERIGELSFPFAEDRPSSETAQNGSELWAALHPKAEEDEIRNAIRKHLADSSGSLSSTEEAPAPNILPSFLPRADRHNRRSNGQEDAPRRPSRGETLERRRSSREHYSHNYHVRSYSQSPSFIAVLIAAASTMIIANSPPMDKLIMALQKENPSARASTFEQENYFAAKPLFGPEAIEECTKKCENQDGCLSQCNKLSLSEFARQIRPFPYSPNQATDQITEICSGNIKAGENLSNSQTSVPAQSQGNGILSQALGAIKQVAKDPPSADFASTRLTYRLINSAISELTQSELFKNNSAPSSALANQTFTALCLRQHHSLAELGTVLANQNKDSFSVRFYSALAQNLSKTANSIEQRVIKDGSTLLKAVDAPR